MSERPQRAESEAALNNLTPHILLIEDEPVVRQQLAEILRDEGYRVSEAADAVEGYALIESTRDLLLLITDVGLPGQVDGAGLTKVLAQHQPTLPVLVISGGARPGRDELPPGTVFLQKPVFPDQLLRLIQRLLRGE